MRGALPGILVASTIVALNAAFAQLPQARLNTVFPAGARAGSTVELTVTGADLDETTGLRFSDPRITAAGKPGAADRFEVTVPTDVAEGLVDVRVVGRFGASNPRAFAIGRSTEFTAAATNTSAASAIDLPLDTIANGRVQPNAAAWFRFRAESGQRLIVRAQTTELDSRLVADLAISDADGRELAVARRRGWLDFTAPAVGEFLIKLNDQTYRGGDDFHFRLTVSTGPHVDFALPNVLLAGEINRVTIFGRNLPGGSPSERRGIDGLPLAQLAVEIAAPAKRSSLAEVVWLLDKPASAAMADDAFAWRLNGAANPLLFGLTTNAVATGLTNELTQVTPPCEYSAFFPERSETSGVTFSAEKGEVFWLELFGDRLGYPSDPHAVVQRERSKKSADGETLYADVLELNDAEANLGDREFNTATRDAVARFEAPETGNYRVLVRDRFNLGATRPRFAYRLSIRREVPDFRLVALPMPPPRVGDDRKVLVQSLTVRREETVAIKVLAFRRDGFDGEIQLSAINLPPGVTMETGGRILAGQNSGTLLLTASPEATGVADLDITGTAAIGSNVVNRSCSLASVLWHVPDFNNEHATSRLNRDAPLAVIAVETAPVSIMAADAKPLEVAADGKLTVPLLIERRGDFNAAFNLKPVGHPALDKAKEFSVAEKATNAVAEIALTEFKLPEGVHTIWFQGTVAGKYRNNPEAIAVADAELQAADKALASVSDADKPKAEERRKAAEAAKKAAEERAKPRDVTVPVHSRALQVRVLPAPPKEEKK